MKKLILLPLFGLFITATMSANAARNEGGTVFLESAEERSDFCAEFSCVSGFKVTYDYEYYNRPAALNFGCSIVDCGEFLTPVKTQLLVVNFEYVVIPMEYISETIVSSIYEVIDICYTHEVFCTSVKKSGNGQFSVVHADVTNLSPGEGNPGEGPSPKPKPLKPGQDSRRVTN